jgi:hypothetical protein
MPLAKSAKRDDAPREHPGGEVRIWTAVSSVEKTSNSKNAIDREMLIEDNLVRADPKQHGTLVARFRIFN